MVDKSQGEKLNDMHTVLLGIPGTEERGLSGDVKDLLKQVKILNGCVKSNTAWRKLGQWLIPIVVAAISGLAAYIAIVVV